MKEFFVEYWPVWFALAQFALAALMLKVDARTTAKIDAAVEPVKREVIEMDKKLIALTARVNEAESDIDGLPTKADLERVHSEAKAAHQAASSADAGIQRLETLFLEEGVRFKR